MIGFGASITGIVISFGAAWMQMRKQLPSGRPPRGAGVIPAHTLYTGAFALAGLVIGQGV